MWKKIPDEATPNEPPWDGALVLVTRVPAVTKPPLDLVRWSRGMGKIKAWRRKGGGGRLRYTPTHWAAPLAPPTEQETASVDMPKSDWLPEFTEEEDG